MMLFGHGDPHPGQLHHGIGIHESVPETVGHVPADPIGLPVRGDQVLRPGGPHHYVLHVAPRQTGIGLEGQGADARSQRGRGAGARVAAGAGVVQVRRDYLALAHSAAAVGGREGRAARLAVPRHVTLFRGAGYRQAVDGVRVAVAVAVVVVPAAVARGPDKYRAFAISTL